VLGVKTAFPLLDIKAVREGLRNFKLPARFERLLEEPLFVIDGAHTPCSIEFCTATFTALYGEGGILIFGCAAGKDIHAMAKLLTSHFSRIIITTPGSFKKSFPRSIFETFSSLPGAPTEGNCLFVQETRDAVTKAIELGREGNLPILGTGSFYLAAEIRNILVPAPPAREG
jgi:dihydrofolate synthase/folylpolyglutamate synthase